MNRAVAESRVSGRKRSIKKLKTKRESDRLIDKTSKELKCEDVQITGKGLRYE
jgi:hypothetical protein